ncbi:MAG: FAD-binding protein, partial [Acidimicrobiales bacterium]
MTRNWGTNHRYPRQPTAPASFDQLREIVLRAGERGQTIRPLGSRHSFNAISDAEVMIELHQMPEVFQVDSAGRSVTVNAAMTFGRFAELAEPAGIALHNLGSLPQISIAGAVATGTHGSGDRNGNIATAVVGLELLTSDGELKWLSKSELAGSTVALGALGLVTRIELRVEPSYL